jgi:hypothetical protein
MIALSKRAATLEAYPFLGRLMRIINPRCILCISKTAYDLFNSYHCRKGTVFEYESPRVYTPNGSYSACLFLRARGFVPVLGREIPLLVVGHPSKYANRTEWSLAVSALRSEMQEIGICPIENCAALVNLPAVRSYAQAL